jgi:hypothetical protein
MGAALALLFSLTSARARTAPTFGLGSAPTSMRLAAGLRAHSRMDRRAAPEYYFAMQLATGTVVNGKVVVEGLDLPEGTVVTVLTRDEEPSVDPSSEEEAELLAALGEANREEGISAEELFVRLRRFR